MSRRPRYPLACFAPLFQGQCCHPRRAGRSHSRHRLDEPTIAVPLATSRGVGRPARSVKSRVIFAKPMSLPSFVADDVDDDGCPEPAAVLSDAPPFGGELPFLARFLQSPRRQIRSPVLQRIELREVLADDLFATIALEARRPRIPAQHEALGVEHVDRVVDDRVDQQVELNFSVRDVLNPFLFRPTTINADPACRLHALRLPAAHLVQRDRLPCQWRELSRAAARELGALPASMWTSAMTGR